MPTKAAIFSGCIIALLTLIANPIYAAQPEKNRLIVTTDIGGADPDDIQSMIHLLLLSDCVDIEGLISSPAWVPHPDHTSTIRDIIDKYDLAYDNLIVHSPQYPSAEYLKSIVVRGQSTPHMEGVGIGKDSPGSELIIRSVDKKNDPRPVWLTAWGGMNTIAQAIFKVKHTRSESEFKKFIRKIRIYDILGQDDAGAWIAKNFPEITYIRNTEIYGWAPDDRWTDLNVQNQGALGSIYPDRIWATEGDSPAFLYLVANGLNTPEHPEYGGWGGRFDIKKKNIRGMDFIVKSGKDESVYDDYFMLGSSREGIGAINKWKEHIYNDFAARIKWSETSGYDCANHHPLVVLNGNKGLKPVYLKAKPGQIIKLDAKGTHDPDNDPLKYNWTFYREPSQYDGDIVINGKNDSRCSIAIPTGDNGNAAPSDSNGKELHIILEVTDNAPIPLTSYRRTIITVTQ